MNYIGSKNKLTPWIKKSVIKHYGKSLKEAVFADFFAGTGQVARGFKTSVKKVITNDLEDYSVALNAHYIGNSDEIEWPSVDKSPYQGIISNNFSELSNPPRMYYTVENAMKIDGIRKNAGDDLASGKISQEQYNWLIASLIEAADKVANTSSVYGAFLKNYKKTAIKPLDFYGVHHDVTNQKNEVLQGDANVNIKKVSGDILYLDPPYNQRQYGANYHVLNHIVNWKEFQSDRITGLTEDYNKSDYCYKNKAADVFDDLIKNSDFEFIFVSYNNEGIIPENTFKDILTKYGRYELETQEYQRLKVNSADNQSPTTTEYLHILVKK